MAVPFCLPSDEETDEHYRRLRQFVSDLYDLIRLILFSRNPADRREEIPRQALRSRLDDGSLGDLSGLPDLVRTTLPGSRKPPAVPSRRRRRRPSDKLQTNDPPIFLARPLLSRVNLGIELRQVAEEIRSHRQTENFDEKRVEVKATSLFSLLLPTPLQGPLWTAVIILVGWRLLIKTR